jgi:hypothetical protein
VQHLEITVEIRIKPSACELIRGVARLSAWNRV